MTMTDLASRNDIDTDALIATTNVAKEQRQLAPRVALPVQANPPNDVRQEDDRREQGARLGGLRRLFTSRFRRGRETTEYRLPDGAGMLGRNNFDPFVGRRI